MYSRTSTPLGVTVQNIEQILFYRSLKIPVGCPKLKIRLLFSERGRLVI